MTTLFALRNFLPVIYPHMVLVWFYNNFMDEWHEMESKHMFCTGVLVLQLKAFYQESLPARSIDLKSNTGFSKGYSVNKESKNTRS